MILARLASKSKCERKSNHREHQFGVRWQIDINGKADNAQPKKSKTTWKNRFFFICREPYGKSHISQSVYEKLGLYIYFGTERKKFQPLDKEVRELEVT